MEASKICQNGGLTINWGKVRSFWRHSSYFKKHAYQLCNKKGKLDSGFGSESLQDETGNQRFAVFVGKCFHLHDCFFKLVAGMWLTMSRFLSVAFCLKTWEPWELKAWESNNCFVFLSANDVFKKMSMYNILWIPP